MTQAYIFDMDGTLFKTHLILEPALEATFTELRKQQLWSGETPIQIYRDIMGVPLPVVWQTLCPHLSTEQQQQANHFFQQALIDEIESGRGSLYEDVETTLAKLAHDYPLHIASNGNLPYLEAIVETFQLQDTFTSVHSIDAIASGNKSELVQSILDDFGYTNAIVIGDRLSDFKAAKDNKLASVGVDFDFAQIEELKQADRVIKKFSDLLIG